MQYIHGYVALYLQKSHSIGRHRHTLRSYSRLSSTIAIKVKISTFSILNA